MTGYPVAYSQAEFISMVVQHPEWRDFAVDSRAVGPGSVFFALPGERSDGHRFIPQAIEAGARAIVLNKGYFASHEQTLLEAAGLGEHCDESPVVPELTQGSQPVIFVPVSDSLVCLQQAGAARLDSTSGMRIGITGSNGKTGTRDMLASVCSLAGSSYYRSGNFNSVIGLPMVLAAAPDTADYYLFEMAMSEKGEMATLAQLVLPNIALITNIGTAHIGNIGSVQGIAHEKFQIFSAMGPKDLALIPKDDPNAMEYLNAHPLPCRVRFYGCSDEFGYRLIESTGSESRFMYEGRQYVLAAGGKHMIHNACGVIALASELGIDGHLIENGLETYRPPQGRGVLISGAVDILDDSYNANPDSMAAAFATAADLATHQKTGSRRIFVLGDMKELGAFAEASHRETLRAALNAEPDFLLLLGEDFYRAQNDHAADQHASPAARRVPIGSHLKIEDLQAQLLEILEPGDVVLLKGSRSMGLERLIPRIHELFPQNAPGDDPSV